MTTRNPIGLIIQLNDQLLNERGGQEKLDHRLNTCSPAHLPEFTVRADLCFQQFFGEWSRQLYEAGVKPGLGSRLLLSLFAFLGVASRSC